MDTTPLPTRPAARSSTPIGPAAIVAETALASALRDGDQIVVQLLAGATGTLVRIGYRRSGRMVRGPLTVAASELPALVEAIAGAGRAAPEPPAPER